MTVVMVDASCVECKGTFQREKKRGRPHTKCLDCRNAAQTVMQFALAQRKEEISSEGVTMVENAEPCRDCSQTFMRPKRKGKPPVRCQPCRDKFEAEKILKVAVSQETVENAYSGSKEKLLGDHKDLPNGGEAQCPWPRGCGRIFTSDSACEAHKEYDGKGNIKPCKDPALLGMIPIERRGLPIWRKPMDPDTLAKITGN